MTDLGVRTRQIGTFPVNREDTRVFAGGFGNRLFTKKGGFPKFSLFLIIQSNARQAPAMRMRRNARQEYSIADPRRPNADYSALVQLDLRPESRT
jgi:hypothetical protein